MSTNYVPLSGVQEASGGFLLPPEQGEILVNGILVETGAVQLAGDARSTSARKTNFPIWLGRPTAGPVGEGARKGVTGASFAQASLNIKKFASIVLFTDEQIQDLQNGDLNVLVDAGVRQALSVAIDAHAAGSTGGAALTGGSVFDSNLLASGAEGVSITALTGTEVQKAISAALAKLEENGYGNPDDIGVLLGFGFQQVFRDAREGQGRPLYDGGTFAGQSIDPLYGLTRAHSTNLTALNAAAQTVTVKLTAASPKLNILARGTAPLAVGQPISGTSIPAGAVIKALTGPAGAETEIELGLWTAGAIVAANAEATVASEAATVKRAVGYVTHRPNIHVRIRNDIVVKTSNEATVETSAGVSVNLFQDNLTAILYETRLGYLIHDPARSVVPLYF